MSTKEITIVNDEGDEYTVNAPTKWEICYECQGEGKNSNHMGDWTGSEWAEEDFDFQCDYMSGAYDKTCQCCKGSGKLLVVDEESFLQDNPDAYREWMEHENNVAEWAAESEAERRMGA